MDKDTAIRVSSVSKSFRLPHEKDGSIKSLFINMFRGKKRYENQRALEDISFEVKKGEFFGIVGRNGSGKSTLLKILAGIYSPDKGAVQIKGKLTPFIELGVGFNPELSGRDNVFLNGSLLGFSRKEMESKYDEIVKFAELERFMDQKLKNYSSGMQVRLAFSIAIRANSDILLLDEVLAVGDINFQRKCFDYFNELRAKKQTVVFVSHDMSTVEKYCDRVALIVDSNLHSVDRANIIASRYNRLMARDAQLSSASKKDKKGKLSPSGEERWGSGDASIISVKATQQRDNRIKVDVECKIINKLSRPVIGFSIKNEQYTQLFGTNTEREHVVVPSLEKGTKYTYSWEVDCILNEGVYYVDCTFANNEATNVCDRWAEATKLVVYREQPNPYPYMTNNVRFEGEIKHEV